MNDYRQVYRRELRVMLLDVLESGRLRGWSAGFLTASGRLLDDRLKDDSILNLEGYLIAHNDISLDVLNVDLLAAFADEVRAICRDESLSLRVSYTAMGWLLDAWRYLANARLGEGDPRVVLPACAAVGTGVRAVAFRAAEEGTRILMHMASGPLKPVREAVAMGLQRMLSDDWDRTMYELRRYVHMGDAWQHRVAALAVANPDLLRRRSHALDALDLHHAVLAAYRRVDGPRRYTIPARDLATTLSETIRVLLLTERRAGFAAAWTWLSWADLDIQQIVLESISEQPLASFEESAFLRRSFSN